MSKICIHFQRLLNSLFLSYPYLGDSLHHTQLISKAQSSNQGLPEKKCHILLENTQHTWYYTALRSELANSSGQGAFYKGRSHFYTAVGWGKSLWHMWCSGWACGPRRLQIASRFVAEYPFLIMIQWISHQHYICNSQRRQNVSLHRKFWKPSFYGILKKKTKKVFKLQIFLQRRNYILITKA